MAQERQGVVWPWGQLTIGRSVMGSRLSGGPLVRRRGGFRRWRPSSEGRGLRSLLGMGVLSVGRWAVGFVGSLVGSGGLSLSRGLGWCATALVPLAVKDLVFGCFAISYLSRLVGHLIELTKIASH